MHSDLQWFFGFILVVVVLAYTGWSTRKGGSLFSPATSTVAVQYGDSASATLPPAPPKTPEQEISEKIKQAQTEVAKLQGEVKQAEADANASSLRGALTISLSRGASAASEYVLIQTASANTAPVPLTGLSLRSAVSYVSVTIPKAWRLPYPGGVGEGDTVLLAPGERAYIITGYSPNGMSFQLNKCTGFFAQGIGFTPSLPRDCPSPAQELSGDAAAQLTEACIDYISSFPGCTSPSGALPVHLANDGNCQAYFSSGKISYDRCVALHRNEPNFYRGEWRLYLNRGETLWRARREAIELLDANGKLISAYNY